MRRLIFVPLLFWLISCNESDKNPLSEIEALKNGDEWKGRTEIDFDADTETLTILGIVNEPAEEIIVMKIKFEGPGNYTLTADQALYYTLIGGDGITSDYKIDLDGHSEIEIISYDPDSRVIFARFELKLKKNRSSIENAVEYLHFTDGFFGGRFVP